MVIVAARCAARIVVGQASMPRVCSTRIRSSSSATVHGLYEYSRFPVISSASEYRSSLLNREVQCWLFGERVKNPSLHPVMRGSVNAVAETYKLAEQQPEVGSVVTSDGRRLNRFLHVPESADEVVGQSVMQRELGRRTGTCFQRCVGMDAINSMWSVSKEVDDVHGTQYHDRFKSFVRHLQDNNLVLGGAMTDPKGDRGKAPHAQSNLDMYTRIVGRTDDGGVILRGAKVHQTGCLNSHWLLIMPTTRLSEMDKDWAVVAAVPVDHPGLKYIVGRQSCDTRSMEEGSDVDQGNAHFGGQEATILLQDVWVPKSHVFMDGEWDHAGDLVERFTSYHRRSYVCKAGVGDVLIGAAAAVAEMNGVDKASHIKDKLVEMNHLNETIWATGVAASHRSQQRPAGNFEPDTLLANVCKHHVTRFPYEIARLAQDLAGGAMVTMPSDKDFRNEEDGIGELLSKYMEAAPTCSSENRRRVMRLIENMTMGRNAVGYLTESMHGAGSPAAQRVMIQRLADVKGKKADAMALAGCNGCSRRGCT